MQNVFASVQREEIVPNGAGSTGFRYHSINVGGAGDVAVSRDGGNTFVVYPAANIAIGAWNNISGNALGTLAQGTTATEIILGAWGPA